MRWKEGPQQALSAAGWPQQQCQEPGALGALLPSHRTEAHFPFSFFLFPLARVCRQACWNTEENAQRLPALLRSCKKTCRDYCHSIHHFQQESWVSGTKTALAKENMPNKGCSGHAGVFIAFLCSQGAGRAPCRPMVKEQTGWRYLALPSSGDKKKVVSFPGQRAWGLKSTASLHPDTILWG